ncbi:hypothetical protein G7Y79_00022g051350 [Physcia stellaris]|nr:hypothetical protein G7Y79_00022g051350 [Physcia stellaris]
MADSNNGLSNDGQSETKPVENPQFVDDDIWASFATAKGKKKKNKAADWAENPATGNWGSDWGSYKETPQVPKEANGAQDGQPDGQDSAPQNAADDDWSSWNFKKTKGKKVTSLASDKVTADTGKDSEAPDAAKEVEKPADQSEELADKVENTAEFSHGAVGSCLCDRCVNDAREKVKEKLKKPNWTSNYISKLEGQISQLNEALSYRPRRSRRYSYSDCSSVDSLSDDEEHKQVAFPLTKTRDSKVVVIDEVAKPTQEETGLKVEIKRRRRIQQKYGEHKVERDDEPGMGNFGTAATGNEHVLTVFREFDQKKNFWRRCAEIVSPPFLQVLRQESAYDIELRLTDDRLILQEPMMTLFHNRKALNKYTEKGGYVSDSEEMKEARSHTKLILDFMRKELSESKVLDDLESATPSGLIEFPNIWLLYAPGTIVYTKENGENEAYVVDSVRGVHKSQRQKSGTHSYSRLEMTCWSINYDGEIFGRVWSTHEIFPFKGSKEISSLQLVPEKFRPDAEDVKESLRSRGRQFWALQGQNYREYHGEIWSQHMSEDAIRVMVDHLTYQRREDWPISINNKQGPAGAQSKNWRENRFGNHYRSPPLPIYDDYPRTRRAKRPPPPRLPYDDGGDYNNEQEWQQDDGYEGHYEHYTCERPPVRADSKFKDYDMIKPDSKPDDLALLLCPQHVHGYCLRDKVWKSLNVNQLTPVKFRKNAWDRLVLDSEYKDIVQAMVSSYVDKTASLEDLVAGKGAGLVALLHGPPGTGKTLTAECVADSFEKPLYQVTCGDIGTDPAHLESRLEEIFDYAVTWGAILLLDEADVFLQERDYLHLERNALVSIFLRTLEYFNGILFLTTNRIGTFDQAFQSRVHVTLGLPSLDRARRTEVWHLFLDEMCLNQQLISASEHGALSALVRDEWSKENLNGRQIRNAVRTAMLVAEKKKQVPAKAHFETVLKIGRDFERYMSALQRAEPEAVAEKKGERLAGVEGFLEVERP